MLLTARTNTLPNSNKTNVSTCSYCGLQNPEKATACAGCGTKFPDLPLPVKEGTERPGTPPSEAGACPPARWSERRVRGFELGLVLFVAFAGPVFLSGYVLLSGEPFQEMSAGSMKWIYSILHELGALGVLAYVLFRNSAWVSSLGLRWSARSAAASLPLAIVGLISCQICYLALYGIVFAASSHGLQRPDIASKLLDPRVSVAAVVMIVVNGFYEELIVRAYLMTEIKWLSNSTLLAIVCSVALQTAYHFYQGIPTALSYIGLFLVMSVYYSRTNRILPVILAHILIDLSSVVIYALKTNSRGG